MTPPLPLLRLQESSSACAADRSYLAHGGRTSRLRETASAPRTIDPVWIFDLRDKQADVTPERQSILDRLCSGKVFPPPPAPGRGVDGGGGGEVTAIGAVYGNGTSRLPNDLPAQPSFVTADRWVPRPPIRKTRGLGCVVSQRCPRGSAWCLAALDARQGDSSVLPSSMGLR